MNTVDGVLRDWEPWGHCSATCEGQRKRTRACIPPTNGGAPCSGNTTDTEQCGAQHCPGISAHVQRTLSDKMKEICLLKFDYYQNNKC